MYIYSGDVVHTDIHNRYVLSNSKLHKNASDIYMIMKLSSNIFLISFNYN